MNIFNDRKHLGGLGELGGSLLEFQGGYQPRTFRLENGMEAGERVQEQQEQREQREQGNGECCAGRVGCVVHADSGDCGDSGGGRVVSGRRVVDAASWGCAFRSRCEGGLEVGAAWHSDLALLSLAPVREGASRLACGGGIAQDESAEWVNREIVIIDDDRILIGVPTGESDLVIRRPPGG